jgi:DNA-binding NtrC family response regulator
MSRRTTVLVVDDEAVVREAARRVLGADGYDVALAADVAGALRHAAAADCSVVVCDLKLPDGSGLEVLHALRRLRPGLPFVMTTGYATNESLCAIAEARTTSFLPKPFDAAELTEAVSRAVTLDVREEGRNAP